MKSFLWLLVSFAMSSHALGDQMCIEVFNEISTSPTSEVQQVLDQFQFPDSANLPISNLLLRRAVYDAFGGKDFYTGQPIEFSEMRIDHIVPKSLGGPDNFYNYVPTTSRINSKKSASFDATAAIPMLFLVRTSFAPRVQSTYEASIKARDQEREKLRLQREREAAVRTPPKPKPPARGRSQTVTHRGVKLDQGDQRITDSLLILKKYMEEHPENVHDLEIFIPKSKVDELRQMHPEFSVGHAFAFIARFVKVFADGRASQTGGSRFFAGMTERNVETTSPENNISLSGEFDPLFEWREYFEPQLLSQDGYIINANTTFSHFLFDSSYEDFKRIIESDIVDINVFVRNDSIRLEPVSKDLVTFLVFLARYSKPLDGVSNIYTLDTKRANADGHGDLATPIESLMSQELTGILDSGKNSRHVRLINSTKGRRKNDSTTMSGLESLEFEMHQSVFNWLRDTPEEEIYQVFETRNVSYEVELPPEVTPDFYRR